MERQQILLKKGRNFLEKKEKDRNREKERDSERAGESKERATAIARCIHPINNSIVKKKHHLNVKYEVAINTSKNNNPRL